MRAVLVLALILPAAASAAETCPALFADGHAPVPTNPKLSARTLPLCFEAFAVLHSGVSRTPLYAAEHLTRAGVAAARRVMRDESFHDEDRVPADQRAGLDDYVHSGFDRGHLAPAGDMPSETAQGQSFSLANVVPQNRAFNRGLWAGIEESTRRLASRRGELFVVTGAVFEGGSVQSIKGRVLVPTQMFKAIYDPSRGQAGAYLAPNRTDGDWRAVSLATLRDIAGLDVFPGVPDAAKATAMSLPEPREFARGDGAGGHPHTREESWQDWLGRELGRVVRRAYRDLLRSIF